MQVIVKQHLVQIGRMDEPTEYAAIGPYAYSYCRVLEGRCFSHRVWADERENGRLTLVHGLDVLEFVISDVGEHII